MSENVKKPPVYAFCNAGCKWRVPHYSELEGAAYMTPYAEGLYITLGLGSYKIFRDGQISVYATTHLGEATQTESIASNDGVYGDLTPDAYDGAEVRFLTTKKEVREVQIDASHISLSFCVDALIEINGDRRWVLVYRLNVVDMKQSEVDALFEQPLEVVLVVDNLIIGTPTTEDSIRIYKLNKDARLVIQADTGVKVTHDGNGNVTIA